MRYSAVWAIGLVVVGILCGLEFSGSFIVISYSAAKMLCTVLALGFLFLAILLLVEKGSMKAVASSAVFFVLLLTFGLTANYFPGSPRKQFYILAHEVKMGDSVDSVKAKFNGYESWSTYEPQRNYNYISFRYSPSLGTTDSVAIRYDPKTLSVLGIDYSPD
jgi:hypothetical protein